MLPPVTVETRRVTQNTPPKNFPNVLNRGLISGSPFLITHIGPPLGSLGFSIFLYSIDKVTSENLSAIPNTPTTHIQNIAPGPPSAIASATPPIFPRPTVADNAAVKA